MSDWQLDPERGWVPAKPIPLPLGVRFGMACRRLWEKVR